MKSPLFVLISLCFLASCQTPPPPIPADAPSQVYFQRAQSDSDISNYQDALDVYRSFLANRPDASHEDIFSARYEIALLLDKLGKKAEARADFEGILADYDDATKALGAPAWVKILSQKKLQQLKDEAAKAKNGPNFWPFQTQPQASSPTPATTTPATTTPTTQP